MEGHLKQQGEVWVEVVIKEDVFLHAEALADPQVVEKGALLHLDRQIHQRHVCVVECLQNSRLAEVQLLELVLQKHFDQHKLHISDEIFEDFSSQRKKNNYAKLSFLCINILS